MDENKRIVEINGVKLEVDLREAKVIDCFKVGDPVRVFHPSSDYRGGEIKPGVIVGFCEFENTPAIEILELNDSYSDITFSFLTLANEIKSSVKIAPYDKYDGLFSQADVVTKFNRQIERKEHELVDLKMKKKYFIDDFAKAFREIFPREE